MRLTVIVSTIAILTGCSEGSSSTGTFTSTMVSQPSLAATTQMVPSVFPLTTFASGCRSPHGSRWTIAFDLVVVQPARQMDMSVDNVTFRLITGESVGGPMITYPQPQLARHVRDHGRRPEEGLQVPAGVWLQGCPPPPIRLRQT